jgi:hypothetical protein
MHDNFQALKKASYVSWTAMAVLLLFAFLFYKERALYLDSSYVLFRVVNDGHLAIQENRYGSFITQIVPLIGTKFHLSMKVILMAYTVSFNVFYLIIISLLIFKLRQYALAILMSLYYLLFVTDTFYWSNNEVHQGIAWMFLILGLLQYGAEKQWGTIVSIVLLAVFGFLAISSHMLVVMPFTFIWFYQQFDKDNRLFAISQIIPLSVFLIVLVWFKYHYSVAQSYDGDKLKATDKMSLIDIYYAAKSTFGADFIKQCVRVYWIVPILFCIGIFRLLKDKKWWLAIMTIGACAGYYIFMCITFMGAGNYERFHIESEWMGLGIISSAPFVLHFLPKLKPTYALYCLAVICIVRLTYILQSAPLFTKRLQNTENVMVAMQHKGITKLGIIAEPNLRNKWTQDWALPEESLLLSAVNNEKPLRSFFILHDGALPPEIFNEKTTFVGCFHNYLPAEMNVEYFAIDTTRPYTLMTYDELMK